MRGLGKRLAASWAVALFAGLLPAAPCFAEGAAQAGDKSIVGTLEVDPQGSEGAPERLALVADEARYVLAADAVSAELREHVGRTVKVVGALSADERGDPVLTVESFEIVEG